MPIALGAAALFLGVWPVFECVTIQFPQLDGSGDGLIIFAGTGSYRTENAEELSDSIFYAPSCKNYGKASRFSDRHDMNPNEGLGLENYEKDAMTTIVKAFSIIAPVFGALILLWSEIRFELGLKRGYQYTSLSYIITAIFQGLVLLITSSSLCDDNPALQYLEANDADLADTFSSECQIARGYLMQAAAVAFWILAAIADFFVKDPEVKAPDGNDPE